MSELIFRRKVIMSGGSLLINVPVEIAEAMGIEKGDTIEIIYKDGAFTCRKK